MRPRRKTSDIKSQASGILDVLAKKLPDKILQEYIKDLSPTQVRKILQDAAKILRPLPDKSHPAQAQATLWHSTDRDWKGKLSGRSLQLYSDGASRGNPGEAGAGVVILDDQGNELVAAGQYLGRCTNNEAEYRALLYGLAKCGEFGSGRLTIHLDSELIVKQILGKYRVKHPNLVPLFKEAKNNLSHFSSYHITHVRREQNSRADQLANQAIDDQA